MIFPSILGVIHSTMRLHSRDYVDFRSFHLHWLLHLLMGDLCEKRVEHAEAMRPAFHAAESDGWHHLVSGNGPWFFLKTSSCRRWILSIDYMVTKPRVESQSNIFMFKAMCNPSGLDVVDRLPDDAKMNSDYFVTKIFIPLEQANFP
jgi:hypothetical protein